MLLLPLYTSTGSTSTGPTPVTLRYEMPTSRAPIVRRSLSSSFMTFALQRPLDTNVCSDLTLALKEYHGPTPKISSMRRGHNHPLTKANPKSCHARGRAVDFEFSDEIIEWLVSEQGTAWREKFNVTFYIEGKSWSKRLKPYKQDPKYSKYVLTKWWTTGDHIHLNI